MTTVIRPEISERNKYWISKHRHYELKHFCLQYPSWKKQYAMYKEPTVSSVVSGMPSSNIPGDPTGRHAVMRTFYGERISLVEDIARATDDYLYEYILKAVTEELSYTYLKTRLNIPCSRNTYYDRYRRFFWLLNQSRN